MLNWPFKPDTLYWQQRLKQLGWKPWGVAGLILLVVLSAQLLVLVTHESRNQQVRMQTLTGEKNALEVEWGRLLLEESALVAPARMEQLGTQSLNLRFPEPRDLNIREVE